MMKMKLNKKIAGATAMLMLSATMLGTSTFAWFTMNKEVTVTGMEMKAHAEEGLLINEVKLAASNTWDDAATANATTPTTVVLRPASTSDMTKFWHANSKKSYKEAGIGELEDTVDVDSSGNKYIEVTAGATNVLDNIIVDAEDATTSGPKATGNSMAETHVYYKEASFGTDAQYDDGEGFYAKYIYYLKSSGDTDLVVNNLQAQVKATKKASDTGTSTDLEKSLRVGIAVPASASASTIGGYKIFAPVAGADASYSVTTNTNGSATASVTAITASMTGTFTEYTKLNNVSGETTTNITIPNVNSNGLPVYVYVWFEGEDQNCKSDNLTSILSTYDIDIQFKDAAIY